MGRYFEGLVFPEFFDDLYRGGFYRLGIHIVGIKQKKNLLDMNAHYFFVPTGLPQCRMVELHLVRYVDSSFVLNKGLHNIKL